MSISNTINTINTTYGDDVHQPEFLEHVIRIEKNKTLLPGLITHWARGWPLNNEKSAEDFPYIFAIPNDMLRDAYNEAIFQWEHMDDNDPQSDVLMSQIKLFENEIYGM